MLFCTSIPGSVIKVWVLFFLAVNIVVKSILGGT
jgi:hypothetical protein